ncbi:MAG TPA: hypothetical protein V6D37_15240 [Candidatus Sericytochromatia bacterium]
MSSDSQKETQLAIAPSKLVVLLSSVERVSILMIYTGLQWLQAILLPIGSKRFVNLSFH